ncbi:hypothetical protein TcWFU_002108 [Taenia crassiceps]|uniref:Secreted protein n=1 Tax=Taenia crassiceps TaxID=6207 RepID=A0ABR4Q7Z1_9CEST
MRPHCCLVWLVPWEESSKCTSRSDVGNVIGLRIELAIRPWHNHSSLQWSCDLWSEMTWILDAARSVKKCM